MRQSSWKIIAGLLIVSIINLSAEADSLFQADLSAGSEVIFGDTEYTIGGRVKTPTGSYVAHFPISRLDFPVYAYLLSLNAGITVKDRLTCTLSWGKDLTDNPDKLRDYDWQTPAGGLSIYSESALDMNAEIFSGKIQYRILRIGLDQYFPVFNPGDNCQVLTGAGCLFRAFDFNAFDTFQTYPGQQGAYDLVSGRTLAYSVEYLIPFLELGLLVETATGITAQLSVGYSPLVDAKDEDRHLLRDMRFESDCEGEAWIVSFQGKYNFFKHWFALSGFSLIQIKTEGSSQTYIDGNWDHSIDTEIESRQFLATLALGYRF